MFTTPTSVVDIQAILRMRDSLTLPCDVDYAPATPATTAPVADAPLQHSNTRNEVSAALGAIIVAAGSAISTCAVPSPFSAPVALSVLREPGLRAKLSGNESTLPNASSQASGSFSPTYDDIRRAFRNAAIAKNMLTGIYSLVEAGQTRRASVAVYNDICGLLADGRIQECNAVLGALDPSRAGEKVLLSFLMATTQMPRHRLPNRERVFEAAVQKYSASIGPDRAKKLLERYA